MTIKPGDLVMVVRWDCCIGAVGQVYTVHSLGEANSGDCQHCGHKTKFGSFTYAVMTAGAAVVPAHWLKKIPPLDELEGQPTEEKIRDLV